MNETLLSIKPWGKHLGLQLPAELSQAAHLHAHQVVRLRAEGDRIIIEPLPILSLEQRLERFDPKRHGGELLADACIGAERL
jgi:antitoxin MazE